MINAICRFQQAWTATDRALAKAVVDHHAKTQVCPLEGVLGRDRIWVAYVSLPPRPLRPWRQLIVLRGSERRQPLGGNHAR